MDVLSMFGAASETEGETSSEDEDMRSTFSTLASTDVSSASSSSAGPPRLSDNDLVLREEAPRQAPTRRRRKARRKIVGQRRKRADQVRTIFAVPDLLRSCDNLQVECLGFSEDPFSVVGFRRSDMWERFEQEDRTDNVVVAVEATAICGLDVEMRRGAFADDLRFPFVLGSNFVGVVHHSGPAAEEMGLKPGTRVASIMKWGSNSKYVTSPVDNLSVIPKHLDAADVAATISTFLPAFQALYHGCPRHLRYNRGNLRGRKVLVTGGSTLDVQATLRLARWAGASALFVTAPRHHFTHLKRISAVSVLDEDPDDWLPALRGQIDVVIDYDFPKYLSSIQAALRSSGRLVCVQPKTDTFESDSWTSRFESFVAMTQLSMTERGSMFDFAENFAMHPESIREDMDFLLKLLATRQLRPQIDRFIKLSDVPRAHQEMQTLPHAGAIICEPWKE